MNRKIKIASLLVFFLLIGCVLSVPLTAQTCTTQSAMPPAVRDNLAGAALKLGVAIQSGDQAAVKSLTVPDLAASFSGVADVILSTATRLKSLTADVEQVYLLDASTLKSPADTQFFCTLNHSMAEADFSIPQLPPARYGFAMVRFEGASPYRLSFLLRQAGSGGTAGAWQMAGLYPKPLDAAGHDGLWYWTQSRQLSAAKQLWTAWLYLQEALQLLQPAGFVSSSHLEKLGSELSAATPPPAKALTPENPLIVKATDGQEYRFTSVSVDDSLDKDKIDVAAHLKVDSLGDAASARQRNLAAMAALLSAHPELRGSFHGIWIFADAPGQSPYATEVAMNEIK